MKLKITLLFLVISALFTAWVFRESLVKSASSGASTADPLMKAAETYLKELQALKLRSYEGQELTPEIVQPAADKRMVVHFWASWCAPCVNEVPELIEYSEKNPDVKFVIVSVDDYTEDISKFLKSFPQFGGDHYVKIWDAEKSISKIFNVDRLPMSVIFYPGRNQPVFIKSVVDWKTFN